MLRLANTFTPWTLAHFLDANNARLTQRCLIRRPRPASDGAGSTIDTSTDVATAACALTRLVRPRERFVGGVFAAVAEYRLLVPPDTPIHPADQVLPWWHWLVELGEPTSGTWTLTYESQETAPLDYQATGAQVQSALEALSTIEAGEIAVRGSLGGPYQLRFRRGKMGQASEITADFSGLVGAEAVIGRPVYEVIETEDAMTDQPVILAWLTRRRP